MVKNTIISVACIFGTLIPTTFASDLTVEVLDSVESINNSLNLSLESSNLGCTQGQEESCELVESHGFEDFENGELSPFWGHEFVGVDLTQKFLSNKELLTSKIATSELVNLSEIPKEKLSEKLKDKVNNDYSYSGGSHGTRVNNIILGNFPIGVSSKAELSATGIFQYADNGFLVNSDAFLKEGIKVYQASESVFDDKIDYLKKIIKSGVVTIRSAGNRHPETGIEQSSPEISIIVGQLSPLGVPSASSSEGESVTILAPGRNYSFGRGKYKVFGGTSGAQSIVAGCVANVTSLLPSITQDEVELLIIKSSIPTLNSKDKAKLNGHGTVNCYKLARVAYALKQDWPKSRLSIKSNDTYNFLDESKELILKAKELEKSSELCKRKARLDFLREAFLLNPTNQSIVAEIADLYEQSGYSLNSQLYKSLLGLDLEDAISLNDKYSDSKYFSGDILRYSVAHQNTPVEIIAKALISSDEDTVIYASLYSNGKVDSNLVEDQLVNLVFNGDIDGYNYSLFEKAYFESNSLSAKRLLNTCSEKTREWEKEEYNSSLTSCLGFIKYDSESGIEYLKRELLRDSKSFLAYFKNYFQSYRKFIQSELTILGMLKEDSDLSRTIIEEINIILREQRENYE